MIIIQRFLLGIYQPGFMNNVLKNSKLHKFLSGKVHQLRSVFFHFLNTVLLNKKFIKSINEMIAEHIMMYHQSQNPKPPSIQDILPPPTPKQIIFNIKTFIEKQNDAFGHASDNKNVSDRLEKLSIEEINEFHEKLSSLNKSFFEDHDFSIWKVEQNACNEALDMQKELDARGFIEIVSDEKNKDESND